jgi:hypothetical protein
MIMHPTRLRPENNCAGEAQSTVNYGPILSSKRVPHNKINPQLKIISIEEKGKLVMGPRWWPDIRTD